jgi:hypothetical protein
LLILCAFVSFAVFKKEQVVAKPVVVDAVKKVRFRELDNVEVKSERICNGYIIEKSIADLSKELDIHGFVDLLLNLLCRSKRQMDLRTSHPCTF